MNSDFFTDGYEEKKDIETIEARLVELRHELTHGHDYSTGRSDSDIEKEMHMLEEKKAELYLKLEHEEDKGTQ